MLDVHVERVHAVEDLLVLLIIVVLGTRFINGNNDVVWLVAVILTRLGSFWPITVAVPMVTAVIIVAVVVALVIGAVVVAARWAMSARIFVEAHLGFLGIGVLVGGRDHLANPYGRLVVELGAKLAMVESLGEGGDDLSFYDVGNRIPHLEKASDVATEELGRLLVEEVQIVLDAQPSTGSHIINGEDFFQLFPGSDGVWGKTCEPVHGGCVTMMGR